MSAESKEQIRLSTVGISREYVSEYHGNAKILSIPIDKIRTVALGYGHPVERPVIQIVVGSTLMGLGFVFGLWPLYTFISKADYPGTVIFLKLCFCALPMILIGGWLFIRFFQRRYFLSVETDEDKRKILFGSDVNEQEVRYFLDRASKNFSLNIR